MEGTTRKNSDLSGADVEEQHDFHSIWFVSSRRFYSAEILTFTRVPGSGIFRDVLDVRFCPSVPISR